MNANSMAEPAGISGGETGRISALESEPEGCGTQSPPPLVRIREEHNISRRDIDPDALKVLYRLARNKYTAYLVGGGVRDLLLGRKPKDFDISTNARPEEIRALFRNCILIGRRFRLAHIRYGEKIIETSTFRRTPESAGDPSDPEADLFQRDDNLFGSPQEDALRRDFTVNGLFYDIESFCIIDYVGGMEDLRARRIRSIGDPCIRFREDPVRMIRAIRFASRLDFELDADARDAMVKHGEELAKAAPARLLEEITRLFAFASGEKAVRLLRSTGLLKVILPEVAEAMEGPEAETDALWRRLRALDEGDTVLPDATPALIFSTLLLDSLRLKLGQDWPDAGIPRLRFDKVHAFLEPLSQRLRFPRKLVDRIVHMFLAQHRFTHPGGKRGSIANFVTQDSFHEALALAEIVRTASGRPQTELNHWRDMLAERIYGREEGKGENERGRAHHHNEPAPEKKPAGESSEAESEARKLSRSARRRRNRKMRRQRFNDAPEKKRADSVPAEAVDAPAAEKPPAVPVPEKAPPPAPVPSPEAEAREEKKVPRPKARRSRGKKKEAAPAAPETPPPAPAPVEQPEPADFRPLTAAAFYAAPEPEKKKAAGKGGGAAKSKAKGKAAEVEEKPSPGDSARIKDKPLPMDKADEADTPMHWLDEI